MITKRRTVKRSVLLAATTARRFMQDYAIDSFHEVPERKTAAEATARRLGHMMRGWHQRPNDTAGRWNNYCATCNRMAVVCTETPPGFEDAYGPALTTDCQSEMACTCGQGGGR